MGKRKSDGDASSRKRKRKQSTDSDCSSSSTSTSSSDNDGSGSSSEIDEETKRILERKLKKLRKKEKKKKRKKKLRKKLQKEKEKELKASKKKRSIKEPPAKTENPDTSYDVEVALMEKAKSLAPMTKEEWEKQQNVLKRVYDEETGRTRLMKASGEIMEECVSRERHLAINKQATRGDGEYFQRVLSRK